MSKLKEEELLEKLRKWKGQVAWSSCWEIGDKRAYRQIRKLIQKPQVTEEWIEQKAQEVMFIVDDETITWSRKILNVRNFIRSLVEEIWGK